MGRAGTWQDQKSLVVGDVAETAELLRGSPPDPAVPVAALERGGSPPQKGHPFGAGEGDVFERLPDQTAESQVVVRLHQGIPPGILLMKDRAHGDLSKIPDGKGRGVGHDSMVTKNFKESQWIRKVPIRRHLLANYDGVLPGDPKSLTIPGIKKSLLTWTAQSHERRLDENRGKFMSHAMGLQI